MLRSALATKFEPVPDTQASAPMPTAAPSAADPAEQSNEDRRVHQRHATTNMATVSKVRLKFGPMVTLVDISNGGAQIETTNFRMQPGSTVHLEITSTLGDVSVPATVLRCQLASLLPEPVYRGALTFKRDFDVRLLGITPPAEPTSDEAESDAALDPATELVKLRHVLKRISFGPTGFMPEGVVATLSDALDAAFATLGTPAGRRAGAELGEEVAELFQAMADAFGSTPTATALIAAIEEHLRLVVPAQTIRTIDAASPIQGVGPEAILMTVPRLSAQADAVRLVVEFPDGSEPQELHLQILKAGIQLVAIGRELGRLQGADTPLSLRVPQRLPDEWSRVVVRYNSGQMHKGFTHSFQATKGYVDVMPEPIVTPHNRVIVPFTDLKAIFFVKDHDGDPLRDDGRTIASSAPGRRARITFRDGEQLLGTTVDYSSKAPGFFIQPADPKSNNDRVYVVAQSVADLAFL